MPHSHRTPAIRPRAGLATLITVAAAALAGCGTYEPPKPGVHGGPGVLRADLLCGYETPTASTFTQMRCRRTADMQAEGEAARDAADTMRMRPPEIK